LTISGDSKVRYKLVGVIKFVKFSETMGHYTAFIRSRVDHNQWFHVDDNKVIYTIQNRSVTSQCG